MLFLEKVHYEALKGDEDGGDGDMYVVEDEVDSSDAREGNESSAHLRKSFAEVFLWNLFLWLVFSISIPCKSLVLVVLVVVFL